MKIIESEYLTQSQKEVLRCLWNNEYPEKIKHKTTFDQDIYFNSLQNLQHLLLLNDSNEIEGWAFSFSREAETWFALIIEHKIKNKGCGTKLLNRLKEKHSALNGWVIDHDGDKKSNGEIYPSPLGFYLKNNFKVIPSARLETDKISAVKIVF